MRIAVVFVAAMVVSAFGQPWYGDRPPKDVQVHVVDADGAPVAGVEVACVPRDHSGAPRLSPLADHEKAVTDAQGMCGFSGLKYWGNRDSYVAFASHGALSASAIISLGSNETLITLVLRPGRPVYGLVRDSAGKPLEGVVVSAYRQLPLAISGTDGLFTIPAFPDEVGSLDLAKEGYGWREVPAWTRVEMVLEPGGLIEGRVVDEQGQPLPEAMVSFYGKEGGAELVTDETGAFVMPWLAPAQEIAFTAYKNTDTANWHGQSKCLVVIGERRQHAIVTTRQVSAAELTPDEAAARERERASHFTTVSGRIVLAGKNTPVRGRIFGSNSNSNIGEFDYYKEEAGRTDEDGRFFIDEVPKDGAVYGLAMPDDPLLYAVEGIVQVDTSKGPVENLVLTVAPGAAVVGTAVQSDGTPVVEGDVMIMGEGLRRDLFLDRINRFRFPNLPPGRYTLQLNDVRLELGELAAGELRENVVLTLPAADDGVLVEGTLLEDNGSPIGGADINFHADSAHEHAKSDAMGRFSVRVKRPGIYRMEAWEAFGLAKLGESATGIGQRVALVGDSSIEVPEEGRMTLALTGRRPPWPQPLIGGTIHDTEGRPISAEVTVVHEADRTDYVQVQSGTFLAERLPEGPFLIEVKARGYEAKVLEADKDFSRLDRGLQIVLEDGPFDETPSVWTQVTGRPATEEALAAMPCGKYVQERLEHYRQYAMAETPAPAEQAVVNMPSAPSAPNTVDILVNDGGGKVVSQIVLRNQGMVPSEDYYTWYWLVPDAYGATREIMTNSEGRYTVPNGALIEAAGMAALRVSAKSADSNASPMNVVLEPPSTLVVRVVNYSNEPVVGAVLASPELLMQTFSNDYSGFPESDNRGVIRIEGVPAGDYVLAIGAKSSADPLRARLQNTMPLRLLRVRALPGKEILEKMQVPIGGSDRIAALLALWEREGTRDPDRLAAKAANLSKSDRKALAKLAVNQLEQMPGLAHRTYEQAIFLCNALVALDGDATKRAADEVVRVLRTTTDAFNNNAVYAFSVTQSLFDCVAAMKGRDALKTWVSLATDPNAWPTARAQACVMLGVVGNDNAVKAWTRLRDEARALPGAPPLRESYTHAEKMAETIQFVLGVFGHMSNVTVAPDAWVDNDYATGHIMASGCTIHMRRFGNEWMITKVDPMPVP